MQSQLKILFVDDHAGLRDGLCFLLAQKNTNFEFITASDQKEALAAASNNQEITTAIIDLNLHNSNGLDLVCELRKIIPALNVLIYTMYSDPIHIEKALQSNIQGYITKNSDINELEKAILSVASGELYFNKQTRKILQTILNKTGTSYSSDDDASLRLFENYRLLTRKEQEVFSLLAQKKETAEIAQLLGKSEKTVINQKSIIYQKLNIRDRLDLIEDAKILGVIL